MTWRSLTAVVTTPMLALRMASCRPRFDMTVQTIVLPLSLPSSFKASAHSARMRSPDTLAPLASLKITRSASPSSEMPTSAPCSFTILPANSG